MVARVTEQKFIPNTIMDAEEIFRPAIHLAKYTGMYRPHYIAEKGNTVKKLLGWIMFVFVQLSLWGMTVKYIVVLYRERGSGRIIPILAIFTFHFGTSYVSTLTYFTIAKTYKLFCSSLNNYQHHHGNLQKGSFIKKLIKWETVILITSAVSGVIVYCYLMYGPMQDDFEQLIYPLNFSNFFNTAFTLIVVGINEAILLAHIYIQCLLQCVIFYILIKEFKHLSEIIRSTFDGYRDQEIKDTIKFDYSIEYLRQQHTHLVDVMESANSMLCHHLFGLFTLSIPIICFVLYGLIRNVLTSAELAILMMVAGLSTTFVIVYTVVGARLSLKIHEPLDILMTVDIRSVKESTMKSISMFISRLSGPSLGFRIYELFTLNTTTILTMTGTLVTYSIVMLQFLETSPNEILCTASNSSFH